MMQGGTAGQSAPDRLNRMESMMTATIEATEAALAPLYAVVTDEQKKTADQIIRVHERIARESELQAVGP
jgi:hypothetical protein